ncbi:hypothetical protein OXIME_001576 [Oxyplasma meridianum]|uniref:V-type proton ATPase subunit E n=1 Tax=Oxyplasma meridianum TaxID=3073602 RepID=A0AAX4NIW4_9ARCH
MTLEEIIKDIQNKKDLDLENLSRKFQEDELKLRLDAERRIKKISEDYEKKIANEKSLLERKEISEAELDSRTSVRKKYNELMETGLAKATFYLEDLQQWKNYPEILESMIAIAKKSLGTGCTIKASKADIPKLSEHKGINIVASDEITKGGIKAVSKDGSMELDLTTDTIMADIREKLSVGILEGIGEI